MPCQDRRLRLQRHGGFAGRAGIKQFDRMDALSIPAVSEEEQARNGKCAVSFRESGVLNLQLHCTLQLGRDTDGWRGAVEVGLLGVSAGADAVLRRLRPFHIGRDV